MAGYRKLSAVDYVKGTITFAASEIKDLVRSKIPGFMRLWDVTEMTEGEIQEDLKRLRKERLMNDLRANGFSREVRTWGVKEPERFERGGTFRELGRQALRRERR